MSSDAQTQARMVMVRSTYGVSPHAECAHTGIRHLAPEDGERLGVLMYEAYRGTVDDEGASLAEAIEEGEGTLSGKYGAVIFEASYAIETKSDELASVCVVTDYEKLRPLLAFSLTKPGYQKRGLAACLIEKSLSALSVRDVSTLNLVVTRTNHTAVRLYQRLGFVERAP